MSRAHDRFPCLALAYRALRAGGTLPVVLNAANEMAVEAFLEGKLGFTAIPRVIEKTMDAHEPRRRLNTRGRAAGRSLGTRVRPRCGATEQRKLGNMKPVK